MDEDWVEEGYSLPVLQAGIPTRMTPEGQPQIPRWVAGIQRALAPFLPVGQLTELLETLAKHPERETIGSVGFYGNADTLVPVLEGFGIACFSADYHSLQIGRR